MAKHITAFNIGSSQISVGEFTVSRSAGPQLTRFAVGSLGIEPGKDSDPSAYIVSTIRDLVRQNGFRPGPALVCVAGKDIFPRYVKLPPVTGDKIEQIVFYEAQQNVPFPIDEVVWDYQLMDNDEGGKSVMLVAIKNEVVRGITQAVQAAGFEPEIVDTAPTALYNLARFNYGNREGCMLLIDLGARTTNLVFIEQRRIFCRSIPLGGHTITQELMKEFDLDFKDAEELKMAHAFVAFGGVVEGSESPVVNRVSKTVRSVMTRLHAEITRSINFYRSQQNGNKPSLVLLTGGTSIIPETDNFLREKLSIDVEYLNPFQSVAVSPRIPAATAAAKMHVLAEITGLALRKAYSCPMEVDLTPPELAARRQFRAKLPFLSVAALAFFLCVVCWGASSWRMRRVTQRNVATLMADMGGLTQVQERLNAELAREGQVQQRIDRLLRLIRLRTRWMDLLTDVRASLLDGMWLTAVEPVPSSDPATAGHLTLKGMAFLDKVRDAWAVGEFAAALGRTKYFADRCRVERIVYPAEFVLEFTVSAPLKEPLTEGRRP